MLYKLEQSNSTYYRVYTQQLELRCYTRLVRYFLLTAATTEQDRAGPKLFHPSYHVT
jgi:hypothetical protein